MATNRVKLEDVLNEAKAALEAGEADRATALCRHIFNYYPRCIEASRILGEAYTEKRLLDEADKLFVFVLSADPQDVLGYVDRGFIAYERGEIASAIMYYERALELDPGIEQLREELLRLYEERSGPASPTRIRMTKAGLANSRLRDGFYAQAIEEYNSVLRETPNRLDVQAGLLEAYWRNREYERAEKLAAELVEKQPNLIKANLILWHTLGVRRSRPQAVSYLDHAHALDPLNLVAERLFEDTQVAGEALRYIALLGSPAVPPFAAGAENAVQAGPELVPAWADTGGVEPELGLQPEPLPESAAREPEPGLDVLSLLADTERQLSGRETAGQEKDTSVFHLFEEVETATPLQPARPLPTGGPARPDLPEAGGVADFSLFEEVNAGLPAWLTDTELDGEDLALSVTPPAPARQSSAPIFDDPTPPGLKAVRQAAGWTDETVPVPPVEPGPEAWPVISPEPAEDESDSGVQTLPEPEAGPAPALPASEPPGLPQTEPGADRDTVLPMFQGQGARAGEAITMPLPEDREASVSAASPALAPGEGGQPAWPVNRQPFAFLRRNEQGPVPDFAREVEAAQAAPAPSQEPAAAPQETALPDLPPLLLPEIEFDTPFAVPFQAPRPASFESTAEADQENAAMPVKRGPEDEVNVYDWEREDVPEYLQPFIMDEDEAAASGLSDFNQPVTDIDTSPARIRPQDQTGGQHGDLPQWYSQSRNVELSTPTEPPEVPPPPPALDFMAPPPPPTRPVKPGTGALPAWLDDADLEPALPFEPASSLEPNLTQVPPFRPASPPGETPAAGFSSGSLPEHGLTDFDDLQPFSLEDEFGLEAPPPPPPPEGQPALFQDWPAEAADDAPAETTPDNLSLFAPTEAPALETEQPDAPAVSPPVYKLEDDLAGLAPFSLDLAENGGQASPLAPGYADGRTGASAPAEPASSGFTPFSFEAAGLSGTTGGQAGRFESSRVPDYLEPAPDVADAGLPPVPELAGEKPLRDFGWTRELQERQPEQPPEPGASLFQRLAAARSQLPVPSEPASGFTLEGRPVESDLAGFDASEWTELADSARPAVAPATQPLSEPERPAQPGTQHFDMSSLAISADMERPAEDSGSAASYFEPFDLADLPDLEQAAGLAETAGLSQSAAAESAAAELFDNKPDQGNFTAPAAEAETARLFADEPFGLSEWLELEVNQAPAGADLAPEEVNQAPVSPDRAAEAEQSPGAAAAPAVFEPAVFEPATISAPVETAPAASAADHEAATPSSAPASVHSQADTGQAGPLAEALRQARLLFEQKDYTQSIAHYQTALRSADPAGLQQIEASLKQILAGPDANPRYHRVLGDVYKKQGQFQAALAEYSRALGQPARK